MLSDIIKQNGDGFLEESHMPTRWPLHIDGAVRQRCIHRDTAANTIWNGVWPKSTAKHPSGRTKQSGTNGTLKRKAGHTLSQLWINAEAAITQKTSRSTEIQDSDLRPVASAVISLPTPQMTDSPFLKAVGTNDLDCPGTNRRAAQKQLKNGDGTCAKTKLWQSWTLAKRLLSRKTEEKCSLPC